MLSDMKLEPFLNDYGGQGRDRTGDLPFFGWTTIAGNPVPSRRVGRKNVDLDASDAPCQIPWPVPPPRGIPGAKYNSPHSLPDKEYQHTVPGEWGAPGKGSGRL